MTTINALCKKCANFELHPAEGLYEETPSCAHLLLTATWDGRTECPYFHAGKADKNKNCYLCGKDGRKLSVVIPGRHVCDRCESIIYEVRDAAIKETWARVREEIL